MSLSTSDGDEFRPAGLRCGRVVKRGERTAVNAPIVDFAGDAHRAFHARSPKYARLTPVHSSLALHRVHARVHSSSIIRSRVFTATAVGKVCATLQARDREREREREYNLAARAHRGIAIDAYRARRYRARVSARARTVKTCRSVAGRPRDATEAARR